MLSNVILDIVLIWQDGVHYDEVFSASLETITTKMLKWLKMKAFGTKIPSLVAGVIRHVSETHPQSIEDDQHLPQDQTTDLPHKNFFTSLDKKLAEIQKLASKNTGSKSILFSLNFSVCHHLLSQEFQ
jgi:hypothetical protein